MKCNHVTLTIIFTESYPVAGLFWLASIAWDNIVQHSAIHAYCDYFPSKCLRLPYIFRGVSHPSDVVHPVKVANKTPISNFKLMELVIKLFYHKI